MPNFLPLVIQVAAEQGVDITFSQARYTARRLDKREDAAEVIDLHAYVLQHWDETGETAVKNVMNENAVRRINQKESIAA